MLVEGFNFIEMIIDSKGGNIETIGDVKEFKTTIDPKNLEFITTLLSSNLYSNPEQSFIREIVSNAWDSHVEAGNTDTPVIIKFKQTNGYYIKKGDITIRDYGTGLSEEKFNELYCSIGSSTKRESNEYLGCFGLGHLSPLSCTNAVYITSYYNGEASLYIMTKSGNTITTNLVNRQTTEEKNGVEITIKNVEFKKYEEALNFIVFFPNIYIDGIYSVINDTKIKRFNNFAVITSLISHKLLFGNVLYPLDETILTKESKDFIKSINVSGVVISFNIGELQVTPNRESVIYTTDTINLINKRIIDAKNEIDSIVDNHLKSDIDNIIEWYRYVYPNKRYNFFSNSLLSSSKAYENHGEIPIVIGKTPTLAGRKVVNSDLVKYICQHRMYNLTAICVNDKVYKEAGKIPYDVNKLARYCTNADIIIVEDNIRFGADLKSYIVQNYPNTLFIKNFSFEEFKKYISNECYHYTQWSDEVNFIAQQLYLHITKKAIKKDFSTDKDFLNYKATLKAERANSPKVLCKNINVRITSKAYNGATYCREVLKKFNSYEDLISYIKSLKCGVILQELKDNTIKGAAWSLDYTVIQASKPILKLLREENLRCFIDDWTIINHPTVITLRTLKCNYMPYYYSDFIASLSDDLYEVYNKSRKLMNNSHYEIVNYISKNLDVIKIDEVLDKQIKTINNLYKIYSEYDELFSDSSNDTAIRYYLLTKDKKYRINNRAYKKVQNNKLIQLLCRK